MLSDFMIFHMYNNIFISRFTTDVFTVLLVSEVAQAVARHTFIIQGPANDSCYNTLLTSYKGWVQGTVCEGAVSDVSIWRTSPDVEVSLDQFVFFVSSKLCFRLEVPSL